MQALPDAASIEAQAHRAYTTDRGVRMAAEWDTRLRADSTDPAARLVLGTLAARAFQYDRARALLAPLARDRPVNSFAVRASLELARMSLGRDHFDTTRALLQRTVERARALQDSSAWAQAVATLGFLDSRSVGTASALARLDSAEALAPAWDDWSRALIACHRAPIQAFGGDRRAQVSVAQGIAFAKRSGDPFILGFCYQSALTVSINASGNPTVIAAYADSAAELQRQAGDRFGLAVTLWVRAYSLIGGYDIAGARRLLREAMTEARATDALFSLAWIHRFQGEIFLLAGDFVTADDEYRLAAQGFARSGDRFGAGGLERNLAALALELGRVDEADSILRGTLAGSERAGIAEGVYASRLALAAVRMVRGDWAGAREEATAAREYGESHGFRGWSGGLRYYEGLSALRLGDLAGAEREFRTALAATAPTQWLDRYAIRSRLAEVSARRGDLPAALAELEGASLQLDSLRSRLDDHALRVLVFQTRREYDQPDVGFATIIAALARGDYVSEVVELVEQRRARLLTDRLRRMSWLESGGTPADGLDSIVVSLEQVQQDLPPDAAAVMLVSGRGSQPTTLIGFTRHLRHVQVLPSIDSLRPLLDRFSVGLEAGAWPAALGQTLRALLLDSLLARLPAEVTRLIISAEEELYALPWDALPGRDGRPLLTRYAVSRVPSLSVLESLRSRPGHRGPARVLALGNPALGDVTFGEAGLDSTRDQALPDIPAAEDEAGAIARYGAESVLRTGSLASEAWFKQAQLDRYSIVHLATHALVDENRLNRTAIALAPGEGEDGLLRVGELVGMRIPADLVVLSACRTARGVVIGGEGTQGLASAFLEAGTRSLVVTQWSVADRATADLVLRYYENLARGLPTDRALQQARLEAFQAGASPAVWAAFMTLGDPDVRVQLQPGSRLGRLVVPVAILVVIGLALVALMVRLRARRS